MTDNRERVPRDQLVGPFTSFSKPSCQLPAFQDILQLIECDGSSHLILAASQPKFVTGGISHAGAGGAQVSPVQAHPLSIPIGTSWQPGLDATIQRIVS